MGQSTSKRQPLPLPMAPPPPSSAPAAAASADHTADLPDDLLALIFSLLSTGDRKRCSLVCRHWFAVDSSTRHRLALDARAPLASSLPSLLSRFPSLCRLALRCPDRRADSVPDSSLALISSSLGTRLDRLKLRSLRSVSDAGLASLAANSKSLRKLSLASCPFGPAGLLAVLQSCTNLESLSVKRLRGLTVADVPVPASPSPDFPGCPRLASLSLKELYNGHFFAAIITSSPNLKTLKIIRCSGDWDPVLENIPPGAALAELHLEKIQVSDRGVAALAGLEVVHLAKAPEVTDTGLAELAARSPRLRKLHVDGWKANRIGDRGLAAVARRCASLQELVLIGVNLTSVSLELIAANCHSLQRLALCGSDTFGDAEISCVAAKCTALRKLCIKACPVSDQGMEALAEGCPRLVKVKVKKCFGVTLGCAERLRASRHGALAVNFDASGAVGGGAVDARSGDYSGVLENAGAEVLPEELEDQMDPVACDPLSGSSGRSSTWKIRMSALVPRSFSVSVFRRRSHGGCYASRN